MTPFVGMCIFLGLCTIWMFCVGFAFVASLRSLQKQTDEVVKARNNFCYDLEKIKEQSK